MMRKRATQIPKICLFIGMVPQPWERCQRVKNVSNQILRIIRLPPPPYPSLSLILPTSMIDPLTIVTGVTSLTKLCFKLFTVINDLNLVDESVNALIAEIKSLSTVLVAIGNTFTDPVQANAVLSSPISLQHWQNVQQMLEDCKETLEEFEGIVKNINESDSRILRKPVKLINLTSRAGPLALVRQKLAAYRGILNMSLQTVTLYVSKRFH